MLDEKRPDRARGRRQTDKVAQLRNLDHPLERRRPPEPIRDHRSRLTIGSHVALILVAAATMAAVLADMVSAF